VRVLHLISNYKYTGPVDPAMGLAVSLRELGVDTRLAVGRSPVEPRPLDSVLEERRIEPISGLYLNKHRHPLTDRLDARRLVAVLAEQPVDVLHAHLDNAHEIAMRTCRYLRALSNMGRKVTIPRVVRTLYDGEAPAKNRRFRNLYGPGLAGAFVFGQQVASVLRERFAMHPDRVVRLDGAVALDRFQPQEPDLQMRERLGLPADAIVGGIVARIQKHRRYEILLEAVRRVLVTVPKFHLLVLGRGTYAHELAHERADALGISRHVCLPGYLGGKEYTSALSCFAFKIFLVPGSDGTCRAVREAMAMGIPLIVSRRGLLPELVRDGEDGLVVDDEVESLANALRSLARDGDLRRRLGAQALARARVDFAPRRQAEEVLAAYRRWLV
jgi:glycosyltransferase involved in cell wall biosynthesis